AARQGGVWGSTTSRLDQAGSGRQARYYRRFEDDLADGRGRSRKSGLLYEQRSCRSPTEGGSPGRQCGLAIDPRLPGLASTRHTRTPWQCLNFLPEPQGQGSLRPTLPQVEGSDGLRVLAGTGPAATRAICSNSSSPVVASM